MVGERIAVPFGAAKELEAKRLALPLQLLVPVKSDDATAGETPPLRAPGGIVKK